MQSVTQNQEEVRPNIETSAQKLLKRVESFHKLYYLDSIKSEVNSII